MTHNDAIHLIREGGLYVRLLLRKTNAPPPTLDGKKNLLLFERKSFISEVKNAMGNGIEPISAHWKPSGLA